MENKNVSELIEEIENNLMELSKKFKEGKMSNNEIVMYENFCYYVKDLIWFFERLLVLLMYEN